MKLRGRSSTRLRELRCEDNLKRSRGGCRMCSIRLRSSSLGLGRGIVGDKSAIVAAGAVGEVGEEGLLLAVIAEEAELLEVLEEGLGGSEGSYDGHLDQSWMWEAFSAVRATPETAEDLTQSISAGGKSKDIFIKKQGKYTTHLQEENPKRKSSREAFCMASDEGNQLWSGKHKEMMREMNDK
ncbi:hypothetical protein L218DRAFT_942992 [Marasmius fiardii PR-910]|nr:hypothetical protein L218DRAFT_942992 [Marasmius fiardii PR-910]